MTFHIEVAGETHQVNVERDGACYRITLGGRIVRPAEAVPVHLRLEFLELFLHEGRQSGRRPEANVVGVLYVALGDGVGDVGAQLRVGRPVADQKQVRACRPRDFEIPQHDRGFPGVPGVARLPGIVQRPVINEAETAGDRAQTLEALYKGPQASTQAKLLALLSEFPQGRTVVLLDNLEDLLDPELLGLADAELDEALALKLIERFVHSVAQIADNGA